jgi:hypothetical protein
LQVKFIFSSDQLTDEFTKPATRQILDWFKSNINLVCNSSLDWRGVLDESVYHYVRYIIHIFLLSI